MRQFHTAACARSKSIGDNPRRWQRSTPSLLLVVSGLSLRAPSRNLMMLPRSTAIACKLLSVDVHLVARMRTITVVEKDTEARAQQHCAATIKDPAKRCTQRRHAEPKGRQQERRRAHQTSVLSNSQQNFDTDSSPSPNNMRVKQDLGGFFVPPELSSTQNPHLFAR